MTKKVKRSDQAKQRLSKLKEHFDDDLPQAESWLTGTSDSSDGADLNQFIASLVGKKTRKKYQLRKIKEFFENPQLYGVDFHDPDTCTTDEEIKKRKRELQYRITLLNILLEAAEGELHFLEEAKENKKTST